MFYKNNDMKYTEILKSQKDKDVFFDALLNPKEPNAKLIEAAKEYKNKCNLNKTN